MFEINVGKGKPVKPVTTPSKASKDQEKPTEKEEEPVVEEPESVDEDFGNNNNNNSFQDEDELIIKDELENDCFEEVDRIGDVEKVVRFTKSKHSNRLLILELCSF